MKKKILDAFYAYEQTKSKNGEDDYCAQLTIPMTIISNMLHSRGKHIYEAYDLTQSEIDMLAVLYIYNEGLTASEVSDRMVFSSGGISKVVKKLEFKNLIYKKYSTEDKRCALLYLEDKAREIVLACFPLFKENDAYFYNVLDETEIIILKKAFKKILYSVSED